VLIVIHDVETTISLGEARRLCRQLRAGAKETAGPLAHSAAALVVAEAMSRGLRNQEMRSLVIRERGAVAALAAALQSRNGLSDAEVRLLEVARAHLDQAP
jgi:hypothetical protein